MTPIERVARDKWQDEIERRFPAGINAEQFKALTLESGLKHPDGICWPPNVPFFDRIAILTEMLIKDGTVERKNVGHHTPFEPVVITDKGRAALEQKP